MTTRGDHDDEMFRRTHLDDQTVEQVLSGQGPAGDPLLASFVEDVTLATTGSAPAASEALVTLFAEGLSTDNGDLLATAASNVPGPASQAAGLPKWRKKNVIEILLAKVAALGAVAKTAAAAGALTTATTLAAATGALPDQVQDPLANAVESVSGLDIPGGERQDADVRQDADKGEDADVVATEEEESGETPDNFGTQQAERAQTTEDKGAEFGKTTASTARATFQPEGAPTAEQNRGTDARGDAGTQQPEQRPTADSNPGDQYRPADESDTEDDGDSRPGSTPDADENPGSGRRP